MYIDLNSIDRHFESLKESSMHKLMQIFFSANVSFLFHKNIKEFYSETPVDFISSQASEIKSTIIIVHFAFC